MNSYPDSKPSTNSIITSFKEIIDIDATKDTNDTNFPHDTKETTLQPEQQKDKNKTRENKATKKLK